MFLRRGVCSAVLAMLFIGCGGAFRDAIKRGDQYAQAGMWDKAAAEYEAALALEPNDTDAAIKLHEVRRKQAAERLSLGRGLIRRGELEEGLAVLQEAVRLDPGGAEGQRALSDANRLALRKAEELLATPEAARAFEITQLVLKGSPGDPRAKRVDASVRDALAERSYARGEEFAAASKPGNALIEYAACIAYRPAYRDAKLKFGELKALLWEEIAFYVVLEEFVKAAPEQPDVHAMMKPELVGQAFDERLPLRVVREAPAGGAARPIRGVRVGGSFGHFRYEKSDALEHPTCSFQEGTHREPNPERPRAESAVRDAERRQANADREVDQDQRDVDRYQREYDDVEEELSRVEQDEDRARTDYERCAERARASESGTSTSSCSSERGRYDGEKSRVQSARNRVDSARGQLASARQGLSSSKDASARVRQEVEAARQRWRELPESIEVPSIITKNYTVRAHTVSGRLVVTLRAQSIADKATLLAEENFPQRFPAVTDRSWAADPAGCPKQGKNPRLPSPRQVQAALVDQSIATLREKVLTFYESYRTKYLTDARRHESAGNGEEAVESYTRYLLTGLQQIDPVDGKQISEFLAKTRGFGKIELLGGL